jgi:hypothetical protein
MRAGSTPERTNRRSDPEGTDGATPQIRRTRGGPCVWSRPAWGTGIEVSSANGWEWWPHDVATAAAATVTIFPVVAGDASVPTWQHGGGPPEIPGWQHPWSPSAPAVAAAMEAIGQYPDKPPAETASSRAMEATTRRLAEPLTLRWHHSADALSTMIGGSRAATFAPLLVLRAQPAGHNGKNVIVEPCGAGILRAPSPGGRDDAPLPPQQPPRLSHRAPGPRHRSVAVLLLRAGPGRGARDRAPVDRGSGPPCLLRHDRRPARRIDVLLPEHASPRARGGRIRHRHRSDADACGSCHRSGPHGPSTRHAGAGPRRRRCDPPSAPRHPPHLISPTRG